MAPIANSPIMLPKTIANVLLNATCPLKGERFDLSPSSFSLTSYFKSKELKRKELKHVFFSVKIPLEPRKNYFQKYH